MGAKEKEKMRERERGRERQREREREERARERRKQIDKGTHNTDTGKDRRQTGRQINGQVDEK